MLLGVLPLGLEGITHGYFHKLSVCYRVILVKVWHLVVSRIPQRRGPEFPMDAHPYWLKQFTWKDIGICSRIKGKGAVTHATLRILAFGTRNLIPRKTSLFSCITLSQPFSNLCWSLLGFSISSSKQAFVPWPGGGVKYKCQKFWCYILIAQNQGEEKFCFSYWLWLE